MTFLFGKNLRWLRKGKDLNQQEIGDLVEKGDGTISNWEKGSAEPSFSEINTISNFFGIEPVEMLFTDLEAVHLKENNAGAKKDGKSPSKRPSNSPPNQAQEPQMPYFVESKNQAHLIQVLEDLVKAKEEIIDTLKSENKDLKNAVKELEKNNGRKEEPTVT